ncbi:hypothetical protein KFL_007250030 [Klebsormidium nitens]|uniref:EF-hand domain-containing protein n=1 Tax=Klebsormidium nitens TaxID=105231 RepID=A0A1Y1ILQ8_KLENI|nr:hypothetical protein KFL_007250030 [Klebsormidium nitens]|eukprot:GAQ91082.1 hypothetical protein KFL_007250030 [Klebsormidium nitens]
MAPCVASVPWQQEVGRIAHILVESRNSLSALKESEGWHGKQRATKRRTPPHGKGAHASTLGPATLSSTCLLCSQKVSSRGVRSPPSQQRAKPSLALTRLPDLGGLKASGVSRRRSLSGAPVPARAWLDSLAAPRTAPPAPHDRLQQGRRREPLLDGSIDPQGSWQEEGEGREAAAEVGVAGELTSEELWLSVREQPGFSVERLGGQRIVELVSAWDRLAPQLPPDVGNGAAAQVLLGALKLAVPALQGPCVAEGGRPRLLRALEIAKTLASLKMDAATLAAGVLVEAVAAGTLSEAAVEAELGPAVGRLLHDSGRVRALPSRVDSYDDDTARALRQFCLAFHDVRAIVVELAARLETMRHVGGLPRYQQALVALETLAIYAPMAHALGTGSLMWELEDAAFRVLYPSAYASCEAFLRRHWADSPALLDGATAALDAALRRDSRMGQLAHSWALSSRTKSLYSFMRKQLKDGRGHSEVYDLLGLRMIIKPVPGGGRAAEEARGAEACYRVREVALQLWQEVPQRYKDYIGRPKKNGYQSLHMLVQPAGGGVAPPVELQVRTERMDAQAVSGAAAHGAYKGGLTDPQQVEQLRLIMEAAAQMAAASFRTPPGRATPVVAGAAAEDHVFAMLDKNGDGRLSVEELQAAMLELGASGAGDAAELMTLLDCNTDGSVSLAEFALFRRRIAVLRDLPDRDAAIHAQLAAAWADPPGEVAEASYWPLLEDGNEKGATTGQPIPGAPGEGDAQRSPCAEDADERGGAAAGAGNRAEAGPRPEEGAAGADRGVEATGGAANASWSTGGDTSARRAGLEGSSRELLLRGVQSSSRPSSVAASAGRVGGRALGAGGARSGAPRSQAVGASFGGRGGSGVAAVASRGAVAEELVEELRQRGGRAAGAPPAVVDEQEFLVEKGSDLDRKLSHYTASSAAKPHPHPSPTPSGTGRTPGGANGGADHVLTRQELNRRLAGIPNEGPAELGLAPAGEGGNGRAGTEGERGRGLARALQRVERQMAEGRYDAARTLLNVVAERHPDEGRLWLLFGHLESRDPLGAGASQVYARAQACLEREATAAKQRGDCAAEEWQRVEADLAEARAALRSLPAEGGSGGGVSAARAGADPLRHVLGRGGERGSMPRSGAALHQLALSFASQGNVARARTLLLTGLQAAPRDAVLRLTLARLEADAGNIAAARDHFQLAAAAAPHNVLAWQSWGVFEAKQGDFGAARRLFERGLALDPRDARLLLTWAKQEARRGCPEGKEKATELYQRCLDIDKKNAPAWQAWGLLEAETGNVFGARRLFEACLQEVPHDPAPLTAYARMERLFGALDAARTLLKRATYMDPRHQPAWTEWSLLEQQAGRPAAAAELLERARAVPAPKGAPAPGERKLGEAGNGRARHRKGPRRKEAGLQEGSAADASVAEGRSRLSFEASVQALKDSFRPSTAS